MRYLIRLALLSTPAFADDTQGCYLGPFAPHVVPVGCPLLVYQRSGDPPPYVTAKRGANLADVTGDVGVLGFALVTIGFPEYNCNGELETITPATETYAEYRITLPEVITGDDLHVGGWPVEVVAAAPCVDHLAVPMPVCGYVPELAPEACTGFGCNAGGNAGLGAALLAFAFVMRRHRYDSRRRT